MYWDFNEFRVDLFTDRVTYVFSRQGMLLHLICHLSCPINYSSEHVLNETDVVAAGIWAVRVIERQGNLTSVLAGW